MKKSVALRYAEDFPAPFVLARGRGRIAERIEEIARDSGVPVHEDALLAEGLLPLDPGDWIPESHWQAVAAILAAIWRIEGGKK